MHLHPLAVTPTQPKCDDLGAPNRLGQQGGDYSPDQIQRFTTGSSAGMSTLTYTMSTWNPYTVVIMQTTIKRG